MRVKFNRGPMKNKYQDFEDSMLQDIRVSYASPIDWRRFDGFDPYAPIQRKEGSYHRSNVTLKNGAVVFEWMGWLDNAFN